MPQITCDKLILDESNLKNIISLIELGDKRKLNQLLDDGMDPNIILDARRHFTPLHFAAGYQSLNQYEVVHLLLKRKGNPNFCARDGSTPIHICVLWNHVRILHLLLSHEGDSLIRDCRGKSPLDIAKEQNFKECLEIILFHLRLNYEKSIKLKLEPDSTFCQSYVSETSLESQISELDSLLSNLNVGFCSDSKIVTSDDSSASTILDNCDLKSSPSDSSGSSLGSLYSTAPQVTPKNDKFSQIYKQIEGLPVTQIRQELIDHGENPGPINEDLKQVYLRKLARLKSESPSPTSTRRSPTVKHINEFNGYPIELSLILGKKIDSDEMKNLDHELSSDFGRPDPKKKWRDGTRKTCFNYLLLDPEITNNISKRASKLKFEEQFVPFVKSVFYVGKGQSNRPYEHLNAALKTYQTKNKTNNTDKINRILSIWNKNLGIICVRCFQNAIPTEALTREACMIDSLGLNNLTNEKRGEIYGKAKQWTEKQRRKYGAYLMTRALQVYINDGERQIRPEDLKD